MSTTKRRRGCVFLGVALFAFVSALSARAAPLARAFGSEIPLAQPRGAYIGELVIAPAHAPTGALVTATASGLPANQDFMLVWRTVRGAWRTKNGIYLGRSYAPVGYRIATLRANAAGRAIAHFTVPEDFGFEHDVVVQKGRQLLTQAAFSLDMQVDISPKEGPPGTPIHVQILGIGWRLLEGSWLLRYDNRFTGWTSAVTTHGAARFSIPATGAPGTHVLEVIHGAFTFPYLNPQQNPEPDRPRFIRDFTVTSGPPVLPPGLSAQQDKNVRGLAAQGAMAATPAFSSVGRPAAVSGGGFTPGKVYALNWASVTGNRVGGSGWEETSRVIAQAKADSSGKLIFRFDVPDDLGGAHELWVQDGAEQKTGSYWIAPTAFPLSVTHGPVGAPITLHLKGVGWTDTANIYTVVYDNDYIGYACGFNSDGDIKIFMQATGAPGWHFIDLYPAIYKGKETSPDNFRIPQLTYAADHPGEDLPAFHFAFEVTKGNEAESR